MSTYEARLKRIMDAASLREPDRVPIMPPCQTYPILDAGLSMADVLYDFDKGADAFIRYAQKYQPDCVWGQSYIHMGMGPILELMEPKIVTWAGAPDGKIDKNSIHQYIEFPILEDGEMDMFRRDHTGWLLEKGLPKVSAILEPLADMGLSTMSPSYSAAAILARAISTPEARKMIETFWKLNDMNKTLGEKTSALDAKIEALGFPVLMKGMAGVPFDSYSDSYRGTIESLADLYENEDIITSFNTAKLQQNLLSVDRQAPNIRGKFVFMALHKGMDRFMSDEQYQKYYWKDLQAVIERIIKNGLTPYVYTEGPYTTRLEFLKEVTPGKVIYHFEECDMLKAKKVLGNTACISGGFPVSMLEYADRQKVIDECKRLIDNCAGGGGYIFETSSGLDFGKNENIEAMFETVKTYGKK